MIVDSIPVWALFIFSSILVIVSIDLGYRFGNTVHKKSDLEKESPVSGISASILGLLAFILVFTFNLVSERFDRKREIVHEEANIIHTTWLRANFMSEPDRSKTFDLLKKYVDLRVDVVNERAFNQMDSLVKESLRIQKELFDMAVTNARKDMNSDVAALYVESLNELINIHNTRVFIGWQIRIPDGIWLILFTLTTISMFAVGYQTAIAGSSRTWSTLFLTISYAIIISLIASLDRPQGNFINVPQLPLIELQEFIHSDLAK